MADFLFVFGYETPEEWRSNQHQGTDYESSEAVWISAENEEAALNSGAISCGAPGQRLVSEAPRRGFPRLDCIRLRPLD